MRDMKITLLTLVVFFIASTGFAQLEVTLELPVSEHVLGDPFPARVEIRNTGVRTLYVSPESLEFHSLLERLGRGAFQWERQRGSEWISVRDECLYETPAPRQPVTPGEILTEEVIAFGPGERMVRYYLATNVCVPSLEPGDYRVRAVAALLSYPSQSVLTKEGNLFARWSNDTVFVNGLSEPRVVRVRAGRGGKACGVRELIFDTAGSRAAERFSQCLKSATTEGERGRLHYWFGVKHEMAGELPAAEDAYRVARMSRRGGGVAAALAYRREDSAVTVQPALPPGVRTSVRADVSRAPAGVPIALEVRFTNTTTERMFLMRNREEPLLQQFAGSAEGVGVEVERLANGGEVIWHHCPVAVPLPLTESDFMEIDGRRHLVYPVFPIEPGETRVVRLDSIGVCYDLFVAGTYRIAVRTPTFFSPLQVVERYPSSYYVTSETASEVYRKRERKSTEPVLISVTASSAASSFRDAREAVKRGDIRKAIEVLETIRAQAASDEIRAAALFWEGIAHEEGNRFATARQVYERVARAFPRTASGRIAGHRIEWLRDKRDPQ